jgi:guanylate kinase
MTKTNELNLNDKYKIIALFGEGGSGKDTMLGKLHYANPQYNILVKTTTRDPRDYEIDGVHYHFLSPEDFAIKVLNGDLIEVASFNNWFYGTDIHELKKDTINMGVFSIYGIECMLDDPRLEVYPIYIQASDKTRLLRSLNREQNPNCEEICRRFFADKKDFADIPFDYHVFNNENGSLPAVLSNYIKELVV